MKTNRLIQATGLSLLINLAYAIGHCALGFLEHSWWFITLGVYYIILGMARFSVLRFTRFTDQSSADALFIKKITGILLLILAFCLNGVMILTVILEQGNRYPMILMIAMAAYAFSKVTLGIINWIKARHIPSPSTLTLRNISLADAFVSIFSLQRSMLVSFPGMEAKEIRIMNLFTGMGVCLLVSLLGLNLIGGRYINMAKSNIVKANEKIAGAVVSGYQKIEHAVVGAYEKVEHAAVSGYEKIEDRFVATYLTREGETLEDAKKRLKKDAK